MQNVRTFASPKSESSAVGSALRSGRRGRAFESPLSDASEISRKACLAFLCDFKNRRQPMSQRPPLSDASEISRKACLAFIVYKSVLGISICYRDINLFCERHVSCQYYERAKNYSCRRETRRPQNSPKFLSYHFTKIPERLYLAFQGFLCIRRGI